VGRAKSKAWDELDDALDIAGGVKKLYKLAKIRDRQHGILPVLGKLRMTKD